MRTRAKGSGAEGEERPAYEYYLKEKKDPSYFRQELFQTKGRGVVAEKNISKGAFLLEYFGRLISQEEGDRLEEIEPSCYRFFFSFKGTKFCVDSTEEPDTTQEVPALGRLVNHGRGRAANAIMRAVSYEGNPRLCLFARRDILKKEEILYDYGIAKLPWESTSMNEWDPVKKRWINLEDDGEEMDGDPPAPSPSDTDMSGLGSSILPTSAPPPAASGAATAPPPGANPTRAREEMDGDPPAPKPSETDMSGQGSSILPASAPPPPASGAATAPPPGANPTPTGEEMDGDPPASPPSETDMSGQGSSILPASAAPPPAASGAATAPPPGANPTPTGEEMDGDPPAPPPSDTGMPGQGSSILPASAPPPAISGAATAPPPGANRTPAKEEMDNDPPAPPPSDTGMPGQGSSILPASAPPPAASGTVTAPTPGVDPTPPGGPALTIGGGDLHVPSMGATKFSRKFGPGNCLDVLNKGTGPSSLAKVGGTSSVFNTIPTPSSQAPVNLLISDSSAAEDTQASNEDGQPQVRNLRSRPRRLTNQHKAAQSENNTSCSEEEFEDYDGEDSLWKPDSDEDNESEVSESAELRFSSPVIPLPAWLPNTTIIEQNEEKKQDEEIASCSESNNKDVTSTSRGRNRHRHGKHRDRSEHSSDRRVKKYQKTSKDINSVKSDIRCFSEDDDSDEWLPSGSGKSEDESDDEGEIESEIDSDVDVELQRLLEDYDDTVSDFDSASSEDFPLGMYVLTTKNNKNKRKWDKHQCCPYCMIEVAKLPRHLEAAHGNETEVAQALSLPKKSKERKNLLALIRNKGNHAHNVQVLKQNRGYIIPARRPTYISNPRDYIPCDECFGYYLRMDMWRHKKNCFMRQSDLRKKSGKSLQARCETLLPLPDSVPRKLKEKVFATMTSGEISFIARHDPMIIKLGCQFLNQVELTSQNYQYVSCKMREAARLLQEMRKLDSSVRSLEDCINPHKFRDITQAVKNLAGHDEDTGRYVTPSLALKLGHCLKRCAKILKSKALQHADPVMKARATDFNDLCVLEWSQNVSSAALTTLQQRKWHKPTTLPISSDVSIVHRYVTARIRECAATIQQESQNPAVQYSMLSSALLCQLVMFNRRRSGEAERMKVSDFQNRKIEENSDVLDGLSRWEKKLCAGLHHAVICGKRGRRVPILLTGQMIEDIELLISQRGPVGVDESNGFLFARPSGNFPYRASDCLRKFADESSAEHPEYITSTKLRKHVGTMAQVLSLRNNELDLLAGFMGHNIDVHRNFYRLPENTLQVAKISKLLLLMEKGTLANFAGQSLDDINVSLDEPCSEDENSDAEPNPSSDAEPNPSSDAELNRDAEPNRNDKRHQCQNLPKRSQKGLRKKIKWSRKQQEAVDKHFVKHVRTHTVPQKHEVVALQQKVPVLQDIPWDKIKFRVHNKIKQNKSCRKS